MTCLFNDLFFFKQFDIPRDSEIVDEFSCTQTAHNKYKTSLMKLCIKPLAASQKVSIRTDNRGFLCLQFIIKTEDNHICFVEFFVSKFSKLIKHQINFELFFKVSHHFLIH